MASDLWRNIFIAFKESDESLEQLLLAGKIPQDAFLSWASETYKIPFLDKSFFSQLTKFDLLLTYPSATWTANFFVGSSRVDLQACKLEYSIVSPK